MSWVLDWPLLFHSINGGTMATKIGTPCRDCNKKITEETLLIRKDKRTVNQCKPCRKEYDKNFFANLSKETRAQHVANKKARRRELEIYMYTFLKNHPCVDCNEDDPIVLDFDHQADKKNGISYMVARKNCLKVIKEEIQKCVVRCSNCHRRKTAKDFGYYKYKLQKEESQK